jgi:hypothetical protein
MNTRQKALLEILKEAEDHGARQEILRDALERLSDFNLFALYLEVFGHAVGEREAL